MKELEVRLARKEEEEAAREVESAAFEPLRSVYRPTQQARDRRVASANDWTRWIAVLGGEIVGTVLTTQQAERLELQGLAVRPDRQQQGVARELLDQVEEDALARGCAVIRLDTVLETGNPGIFESLGFSRRDTRNDPTFESDAYEVIHSVTMEREVAPALPPDAPRWSLAELSPVLDRLRAHFGQVALPSPSATRLRRLAIAMRELPRELLGFLRLCDGLTVGCDVEGTLYSAREIAESWPVSIECSPELRRLVPIRGDGCGDYDCLIAGSGPGEGAIVFWDHETYERPEYLLASSFRRYLTFWSHRVTLEFAPDGQKLPFEVSRKHPWPFDDKWLRLNDPGIAALESNASFKRWLNPP